MTYLAVFSQINFFTWSGHCRKLKLIGNLSDSPKIFTVGRLTHKQLKRLCEFFLPNLFLMRAIFVWTLHIFLILFGKWRVRWKKGVRIFTQNWTLSETLQISHAVLLTWVKQCSACFFPEVRFLFEILRMRKNTFF